MRGQILKHPEMCQAEGMALQKGMNFCPHKDHSVLLMSRRPNAPYRDRVEDDGLTLIYEGHDVARGQGAHDPKKADQPQYLPSGKLTENGKFVEAAVVHKSGGATRNVRVYEKLLVGIWADNGDFALVDAWQEPSGKRQVFKFKLIPVELGNTRNIPSFAAGPSRFIPSSVKQEVWLRDGGKCRQCGATTELHFDHDLPFSKGGTSLMAENIQLLCARHNLEKSDKIQ